MRKYYDMSYQGIIFTLPKDEVHFYYGYGIVLAGIYEKLIGVVNQKYQTVLPLTSVELVPKMDILDHGNFICTCYHDETGDYQVMHISLDKDPVNLAANDYLTINEQVVQLYYDECSILYDVITGEVLTPFYHSIGPFLYSEKYRCKVARAFFSVYDENGVVVDELSTIINEKGVALVNYQTLSIMEEIPNTDFPEALRLIREKYHIKVD